MNDEEGIKLIKELGINTVLTVFAEALADDRVLDYVAELLDIGQDDLLGMASKAADYLGWTAANPSPPPARPRCFG